MDQPNFLIVDLGPQLMALLRMVRENDMPQMDADAMLDQMVELVFHPGEAEQEIADFKEQIMTTDILYSGPIESTSRTMENIERLASQLGHACHELIFLINRLGLLQDNVFQYKYHRNLDDRSIIFSKTAR